MLSSSPLLSLSAASGCSVSTSAAVSELCTGTGGVGGDTQPLGNEARQGNAG